MKKIPITISTALALTLPYMALAASKNLKDLAGSIAEYLNVALYLMMGFAVVMFVFNIIKYFIIQSDAKKSEAAQYLMWSLIGFFVILSLWGIVNILVSTFDLGAGNPGSWTNLKDIFPSN